MHSHAVVKKKVEITKLLRGYYLPFPAQELFAREIN